MRPGAVSVALAGLLAAACTTTPSPAARMKAEASTPPAGYLPGSTLRTLSDSVSSPPAPDSPAERADLAASNRLRTLENSDRWLLATRHAELRPAFALSHFDCALGFSLTAADSPRLVSLMERVFHDAHESAERAKARAFRPRPVGVDPDRPACQVVSDAGRASPSYPSGSATVGVAYAAALAAVVPDRDAALTGIGEALAQSRMICGLHYPADVAAGAALGQAVFSKVASTPAFARDAGAAREELARARMAGRTSPACAAERAALATPLP